MELKEKDKEIKKLKKQVEKLEELRIIDILRDVINCFKVFIPEELSKVNQEMDNWTKIKNALRVEQYNNPKIVTNQLEQVLKSLGLTYEEFYGLLELKHTSNFKFHRSFSLENLQEIKSQLENTQFPDGWKLTKLALKKIMDPLEKWLSLKQAPKQVTKTYDEYLIEKSKKSINISHLEIRKPEEPTNQDENMQFL